jgi:N-glycosylase/DNA lyase
MKDFENLNDVVILRLMSGTKKHVRSILKAYKGHFESASDFYRIAIAKEIKRLEGVESWVPSMRPQIRRVTMKK